ncbi:MAG: hypothetical protein IKM21_04655 [Oscillospiraceae bacterium]|nr:hypothetical protein [Oscillospiraceae bacterium]
MKNLFSFLAKLLAFLLAVITALIGIGYFFDKKAKFFRELFAKKNDASAEE